MNREQDHRACHGSDVVGVQVVCLGEGQENRDNGGAGKSHPRSPPPSQHEQDGDQKRRSDVEARELVDLRYQGGVDAEELASAEIPRALPRHPEVADDLVAILRDRVHVRLPEE